MLFLFFFFIFGILFRFVLLFRCCCCCFCFLNDNWYHILLTEEGRQLSFPAKFIKGNKRLTNHDITTIKVPDLDLCELQCYHEPNCVSINFKVIPDDDGLHECELNNATHQSHDSQLEDKDGYVYKGAEVGTLYLPSTLLFLLLWRLCSCIRL